LKRKTYDYKAILELTQQLKQFDDQDPIKYDFALYGMDQEKLYYKSAIAKLIFLRYNIFILKLRNNKMELLTTTTIALSAWEFIGKPFADKARDYYTEKILESLPKLWNKLTSLNDDEKKVIKTVIDEIPEEARKSEAEFKKYIVENIKIDNQNRVIHAKTYIENYYNHGVTNF
jgi:hypothetical protein